MQITFGNPQKYVGWEDMKMAPEKPAPLF